MKAKLKKMSLKVNQMLMITTTPNPRKKRRKVKRIRILGRTRKAYSIIKNLMRKYKKIKIKQVLMVSNQDKLKLKYLIQSILTLHLIQEIKLLWNLRGRRVIIDLGVVQGKDLERVIELKIKQVGPTLPSKALVLQRQD